MKVELNLSYNFGLKMFSSIVLEIGVVEGMKVEVLLSR